MVITPVSKTGASEAKDPGSNPGGPTIKYRLYLNTKIHCMIKIATHDSATGERGQGFLSYLITPFARTQSKTIKEQYEAGCRMFDIRVKLIDNEWYCAHGIWHTKRTAYNILEEINNFDEQCYVTLTYEGNYENLFEYSIFIDSVRHRLKNIIWGGMAIKYGKDAHILNVKYDYIQPYPENWPVTRRGFLPLDGTSWHILLPIPWLWKKVYYNKPVFFDNIYTFVDFL